MLRNVYDSDKNPDGIINMGIANNSLMESELLEFFAKHLRLDRTDLTYGTSLYGSTRLFAALERHFNRPVFSPVLPVTHEHIITGPGCGALLDQLFEHLADPGQSVLVAAPYYNGFDADLATRSAVRCVAVYSDRGDGTEEASFCGVSALRGFEEAVAGASASAVLVCNPHNPVGRCYDREALLEYGRFAQRHNLHLVFDEIYSLSTFATSDDRDPTSFISALAIDWRREADCDPARVHILTSASKDFGLNGLRLGVFISQHNEQLRAALKFTAKLYMVSSPADALWSALLNDDHVYHEFVATNQQRLTQAYETVKAWCIRQGIQYTPSNAGHFVMLHLRRFYRDREHGDVQTAETELWQRCLERGVCITPGSNYHHPTPGVFRLTFSMPQDVLLLGLSRLEAALQLQLGEGRVK